MPSKKTVVLCEGLHDQLLMERILIRREIRFSSISRESLQSSNIRNAQGIFIHNFIGSRRDLGGKYLLKDEMNASYCIDAFIELISAVPSYRLILLVDRIGPNGKDALEIIRNETQRKMRRDILIQHDEIWFSTKNPSNHNCILTPSSLEDLIREVTGSNIYNCRRERRDQIIDDFISFCELEGDNIHKQWLQSLVSIL